MGKTFLLTIDFKMKALLLAVILLASSIHAYKHIMTEEPRSHGTPAPKTSVAIVCRRGELSDWSKGYKRCCTNEKDRPCRAGRRLAVGKLSVKKCHSSKC